MTNIRPAPPPRQIPRCGADALPAAIVDRLEADGVHSLDDWIALGRRRFRIFGVTREMARRIDAVARRQP
jgi:hypothetical protein